MGICDFIGDMCVGKCIGVGVCGVSVDLWCPIIIGMTDAITWCSHVSVPILNETYGLPYIHTPYDNIDVRRIDGRD